MNVTSKHETLNLNKATRFHAFHWLLSRDRYDFIPLKLDYALVSFNFTAQQPDIGSFFLLPVQLINRERETLPALFVSLNWDQGSMRPTSTDLHWAQLCLVIYSSPLRRASGDKSLCWLGQKWRCIPHYAEHIERNIFINTLYLF